MIDPLITLLDGSLDFITREEEQMFKAELKDDDNKYPQEGDDGVNKRYKTNETNLCLMSVKDKIINILQRVIDM